MCSLSLYLLLNMLSILLYKTLLALFKKKGSVGLEVQNCPRCCGPVLRLKRKSKIEASISICLSIWFENYACLRYVWGEGLEFLMIY